MWRQTAIFSASPTFASGTVASLQSSQTVAKDFCLTPSDSASLYFTKTAQSLTIFNRGLSTEMVLNCLRTKLPQQYELAEVVGKWVLLLGAEELKEQTDFFAIHWHTYREGEAVSLLG